MRSHHYESEVVGVRVGVVRDTDLQFVAPHPADLHLVNEPGNQQTCLCDDEGTWFVLWRFPKLSCIIIRG